MTSLIHVTFDNTSAIRDNVLVIVVRVPDYIGVYGPRFRVCDIHRILYARFDRLRFGCIEPHEKRQHNTDAYELDEQHENISQVEASPWPRPRSRLDMPCH